MSDVLNLFLVAIVVCVIWSWLLIGGRKQTIRVAVQEHRPIVERAYLRGRTVSYEVMAYFLHDENGRVFRVTESAYRRSHIGQPIRLLRRGAGWTLYISNQESEDGANDVGGDM